MNACDALLRLASLLEERRAEQLRPHRLTVGQFNLLRLLYESGPQSIGQVARTLRHRPSTMTDLVDRLESRGWVERTHDGTDRRVVRLRICPGKEGQVAQILQAIRSIESDLEERLQPSAKALIDLATDLTTPLPFEE